MASQLKHRSALRKSKYINIIEILMKRPIMQAIKERIQEELNRDDHTSYFVITDAWSFPNNCYELTCFCQRTHKTYIVDAQFSDNTLIIHSVYEA